MPTSDAWCGADLVCRFDEFFGPLLVSIVVLLPCARCFAYLNARAGASDGSRARHIAAVEVSREGDTATATSAGATEDGDSTRLIASDAAASSISRPAAASGGAQHVVVLWTPSLFVHVVMAAGPAVAVLCAALAASADVTPPAAIVAGLSVVGWGTAAWRSHAAAAAAGRERATIAVWLSVCGALALVRGALAVVAVISSGDAVAAAVVYALWGCVGALSAGRAAWSLAGRSSSVSHGAALAPEETANPLSRLLFNWMWPLMRLGFQRPLEQGDLPPLSSSNTAVSLARRFDAAFEAARACEGAAQEPAVTTLTRAFVSMFASKFATASLVKLAHDILQFTSPYLLERLVWFLTASQTGLAVGTSDGLFIVGAMLLVSLAQTICIQHYFFAVLNIGMNLRSVVMGAVYRKALRLSVEARQKTSVGEAVNLMSADASRMQELLTYVQMLWSGPFQIIGSLVLLYRLLGASALAGACVMVIFIPINGWLARWQRRMNQALMKLKDARVNLTHEALAGARLLKLYGWEIDFAARIGARRGAELTQLARYLALSALSAMSWAFLPLLVTLVTFGVYSMAGNELQAATVFAALSLFNILRFPLSMFPSAVTALMEARVSLSRVGAFLNSDELDASACTRFLSNTAAAAVGGTSESKAPSGTAASRAPAELGPLIELRGASFGWRAVPRPIPAPAAAAPGVVARCLTALRTFSFRRGGHVPLARGGDTAVEMVASSGGPPFALANIDLSVRRGCLTAVIGTVGSGKTTLLQAVLGEVRRTGGTAAVHGRVAYVGQTPFILNASLRENVLFGREYEEERYSEVLEACALNRDIQVLPSGDATEIGERGINLSGGQKQRVSMARAVYAAADVYLLDDPLSAVDAHVGAHMFEALLTQGGLLRDAARVLVTHGLQYVTRADEVVVMDGGRIVERGVYADLIRADGSVMASLARTFTAEATKAVRKDDIVVVADVPTGVPSTREPNAVALASTVSARMQGALVGHPVLIPASKPEPVKDGGGKPATAGRIVRDEDRARGTVPLAVYALYVAGIGGRWAGAGVILFTAAVAGAQIATSAWLAEWADQAGTTAESAGGTAALNAEYLAVYGWLSLGVIALLVVQRVVIVWTQLRGARTFHEKLIASVLGARVSFYDTNPLGRILNRFAQDVSTIDMDLMTSFTSAGNSFFTIAWTVVTISVITPLFMILVAPLAAIYIYLQRFYIKTSRELKRLDSVSRSPVFAQFGETVSGVTTIRAYGDTDRFAARNSALVDGNQAAYFAFTNTNRWLATRLEAIGAFVVSGAALFAVLQRDSVPPALAGLSISYALNLTQTLNWFVRMVSTVESQVVAVERVNEYLSVVQEPSSGIVPPAAWPAEGAIKFENLGMRYRENTPLVLKGVSCEIRAGEKIGICGRTGAGKTSLVSALFRLSDVQTGSIVIDGVDIMNVNLHELRSRLAIIPQDPTLFSGTVRANLDPVSTRTDAELWDALNLVGLRAHVTAIQGGLEGLLAEGGDNWSHGQRQLLCMARALLRRARVVVLDEATASCDVDTDAALQRTIREVFRGCTVLTIAHRLNTITDSDRVLVLSDGAVGEFDTPAALASADGSLFGALLRETASGVVTAPSSS